MRVGSLLMHSASGSEKSRVKRARPRTSRSSMRSDDLISIRAAGMPGRSITTSISTPAPVRR